MRRCTSSIRSTPKAPAALVGDLRRLHADIAGNRDFLAYLRNTKTFYDTGDGRELNLVLIDYVHPENNALEVTDEFYCHNGKHGTREDVFLINGIPVLVIECKNATKDEATALASIRSAATTLRRPNCSCRRPRLVVAT